MNAFIIETRAARAGDFPAIVALLKAANLPTDDLDEAMAGRFVVATAGDRLVGVCGLEVFGDAGLPRSLAVKPGLRGNGLGERLIAENERRAQDAGVTALYLLTTTAQAYLQRLGYEDVARDTVPEAIAAHPQFRGLCPASAKCMRKILA